MAKKISFIFPIDLKYVWLSFSNNYEICNYFSQEEKKKVNNTRTNAQELQNNANLHHQWTGKIFNQERSIPWRFSAVGKTEYHKKYHQIAW